MNAALRFVGVRPFSPGRFYYGDRPCLPFLALKRVGQWSQWHQSLSSLHRSFWIWGEKAPKPAWKLLEFPKFSKSIYPKARSSK